MFIELEELFCHRIDVITIDRDFEIDSSWFEDSDIIELRNLHFNGTITDKNSDYLRLNGMLTGTMFVEDAISLEEIPYDFSTQIEENLEKIVKNGENTIDILDVLWQNIVLEVPLQLTEVQDLSQYRGDGWKLVSEDEMRNANNPFQQLKDIIGEE
ncbi:MAG: hypothetical protein PUB18_02575 [bacterium]|nr:hypothetical protein [bacterium]